MLPENKHPSEKNDDTSFQSQVVPRLFPGQICSHDTCVGQLIEIGTLKMGSDIFVADESLNLQQV